MLGAIKDKFGKINLPQDLPTPVLRPGTVVNDVSLRGLKTSPQFIASCEYVENEVTKTNQPRLVLASTLSYDKVDVRDRVTAKEMPIEAEARRRIEDAGKKYAPTNLFFKTRNAHAKNESLEYLVDLYNSYRLTPSGQLTLNGTNVTPSESSDLGKLEAFYLRIKFFKYHLYDESNHVVRAHYQRVNTFLMMCMIARFWRFADAPPTPLTSLTPPLSRLLGPCRGGAENARNGTLQSIADLNMEDDAATSSRLVLEMRKTQTALQRATTSIDKARRLRRGQEIQLYGYSLLAITCVCTFYGLHRYRTKTWDKYKWQMSLAAAFAAAAILTMTVHSIVRPVERFEASYEEFCSNTADTCVSDMNEWAAEATKQTYLTVADGSTKYARDLLTSRNNSMREELEAIRRRVSATDVEYREDMYLYNRALQSKRFVVMAYVVALLLMTVMVLGVPANIVVKMHVAAAVILCIAGVLVYRGNTQRMRKNFHQIYYPKPDAS